MRLGGHPSVKLAQSRLQGLSLDRHRHPDRCRKRCVFHGQSPFKPIRRICASVCFVESISTAFFVAYRIGGEQATTGLISLKQHRFQPPPFACKGALGRFEIFSIRQVSPTHLPAARKLGLQEARILVDTLRLATGSIGLGFRPGGDH